MADEYSIGVDSRMSSPYSSENSQSNDSSPSEGEYSVQQAEKEDGHPKFDFNSWNPETPMNFLSLLPIGDGPASQGYQLLPQSDPVGKIKVSKARRNTRHKEYYRGAPVARDILDEKHLRNACSNGDVDSVRKLLEDGVDPCTVDNRKRSPLHIAAARGDERIVKVLLDSGADPNAKDSIGNTPLHLAACTSQIRVITLLLHAGTDVNALDGAGKTPLHLACGRLRILQEDSDSCSKKMKDEVNQVIAMLRAYLQRSGTADQDLDHLNQLCEQLALSSTRQEVDSLGGLLSDFANLQIQKKGIQIEDMSIRLVSAMNKLHMNYSGGGEENVENLCNHFQKVTVKDYDISNFSQDLNSVCLSFSALYQTHPSEMLRRLEGKLRGLSLNRDCRILLVRHVDELFQTLTAREPTKVSPDDVCDVSRGLLGISLRKERTVADLTSSIVGLLAPGYPTTNVTQLTSGVDSLGI